MNRSTKRIPLYEKDGRGAYGIRTSLQIGTFLPAVYAPVYAVPGSARHLAAQLARRDTLAGITQSDWGAMI